MRVRPRTMVRCTGRGCCVRVAPCAHRFPARVSARRANRIPARVTARRRARASGSPQTRWMRGPLFSRARHCARARPRRRHLGPPWATLVHLGPPWSTLVHLGPPWSGVGRNRPPEIILPVVAEGRAGARLLSWTRPFRCAELFDCALATLRARVTPIPPIPSNPGVSRDLRCGSVPSRRGNGSGGRGETLDCALATLRARKTLDCALATLRARKTLDCALATLRARKTLDCALATLRARAT